MRYIYLSFCFIALLFCAGQADGKANLKDLGKPMLLDSGDNPRMYVIFNHSSHKSVKCRTCHHEGLPGNRYAACTNKECHSLPGAKERDVLSVYMAYHAPDTTRSCLGCHKKLAGKYPDFKGCSPCHKSMRGREVRLPEAKAEAAKK